MFPLANPHSGESVYSCLHVKSATTSRGGGMRMAPRRGRGRALLVVADSIHKPPTSFKFRSMICFLSVSVEPFQFSPAEPVAYELS
jgi:hypothetical protein